MAAKQSDNVPRNQSLRNKPASFPGPVKPLRWSQDSCPHTHKRKASFSLDGLLQVRESLLVIPKVGIIR
jgi:hypothetical protein